MEVSISGSQGLCPDHVVLVRAGQVRRQAKLGANAKLQFPSLPVNASPLQVEVFEPLGSKTVSLSEDAESYFVRLPPPTGTSCSSLRLRVQERTPVQAREDQKSLAPESAEAEDVAARASIYMKQHGLVDYIQQLLLQTVKDRPADPFAFMGAQVRERLDGRKGSHGSAGGVPGHAVPSIGVEKSPGIADLDLDGPIAEVGPQTGGIAGSGDDMDRFGEPISPSPGRIGPGNELPDQFVEESQQSLEFEGDSCILTTLVNPALGMLRYDLVRPPRGELLSVTIDVAAFDALAQLQEGATEALRAQTAITSLLEDGLRAASPFNGSDAVASTVPKMATLAQALAAAPMAPAPQPNLTRPFCFLPSVGTWRMQWSKWRPRQAQLSAPADLLANATPSSPSRPAMVGNLAGTAAPHAAMAQEDSTLLVPKPVAALAELEEEKALTKQVPPGPMNSRSPMPPAESPPCLEAPARLAEVSIRNNHVSSAGAELPVQVAAHPVSQSVSQVHEAAGSTQWPSHEELLARALREAMDAPLDICEDEQEEEEEEEEKEEDHGLPGQEDVEGNGRLRLPSKFGVLAEDRPFGPVPPSVAPSSCAPSEAAAPIETLGVTACPGVAPERAE